MEIDATLLRAAACLGAAFVMAIGSVGPALGQGMIGKQACESIGKYPEAGSKVRITMLLALAMVETSALFCFIIAIMLILFVH